MLHIVLFHPVRLPPRNYGGVERVVLWLAKALIELGQRVSIMARAGSQLPKGVDLIVFPAKKFSLKELYEKLPKSADCIHFMAPIDQEIWDALPLPTLLTVHGNGKAGEKFPKGTVFLSRDHARRHGSELFVYNGLDPAEFLFSKNSRQQEAFLFFSKTSWRVKNLRGAMQFCEKAEVALKIAGGHRPLRARLKAALNPAFHWLGPLSGKEKAKVLSQSKALLFPVLWDEPFGLVVIEALLSGTPVLASDSGSMRELLTNEVGCLLHEKEWIKTLKNPPHFDPELCRRHALKYFHYLRMGEDYLRLYRALL